MLTMALKNALYQTGVLYKNAHSAAYFPNCHKVIDTMLAELETVFEVGYFTAAKGWSAIAELDNKAWGYLQYTVLPVYFRKIGELHFSQELPAKDQGTDSGTGKTDIEDLKNALKLVCLLYGEAHSKSRNFANCARAIERLLGAIGNDDIDLDTLLSETRQCIAIAKGAVGWVSGSSLYKDLEKTLSLYTEGCLLYSQYLDKMGIKKADAPRPKDEPAAPNAIQPQALSSGVEGKLAIPAATNNQNTVNTANKGASSLPESSRVTTPSAADSEIKLVPASAPHVSGSDDTESVRSFTSLASVRTVATVAPSIAPSARSGRKGSVPNLGDYKSKAHKYSSMLTGSALSELSDYDKSIIRTLFNFLDQHKCIETNGRDSHGTFKATNTSEDENYVKVYQFFTDFLLASIGCTPRYMQPESIKTTKEVTNHYLAQLPATENYAQMRMLLQIQLSTVPKVGKTKNAFDFVQRMFENGYLVELHDETIRKIAVKKLKSALEKESSTMSAPPPRKPSTVSNTTNTVTGGTASLSGSASGLTPRRTSTTS